MREHLTDRQVDELPKFLHPDTPERLKYRRAWGVRAGRKARTKGVEMCDNPFTASPVMPMRGGWISGWREMDTELENVRPLS